MAIWDYFCHAHFSLAGAERRWGRTMAGVSEPAIDAIQPDDIAAGDFSAWLAGMERALRGEADSDVPCGTCTACCTSSQFITVEPDETAALARIPRELLF